MDDTNMNDTNKQQQHPIQFDSLYARYNEPVDKVS